MEGGFTLIGADTDDKMFLPRAGYYWVNNICAGNLSAFQHKTPVGFRSQRSHMYFPAELLVAESSSFENETYKISLYILYYLFIYLYYIYPVGSCALSCAVSKGQA